MGNNTKEAFLALVRLGLGYTGAVKLDNLDWEAVKALADQQGLTAIVLDGVEVLRQQGVELVFPERRFLKIWVGEVLMLNEKEDEIQQRVANKMAQLFHDNCIRTYVLKGIVVAECYPKPEHRHSVDMDCFLLPDGADLDAWALGNDLIKAKRVEVKTDFYKNSTFCLPGLTVENHKFMTPFRGNSRLAALERQLQSMLKQDNGQDSFEGSFLLRPPVMVSSLFLIEHAYSHFLHEGLTWRHVLDWMMFSRRHREEIDWAVLDTKINEFGFRKFYDSFFRLGQYLIREIDEAELDKHDLLMLRDVWADLDLHEEQRGLRGKIALAGNTFRARWKYRLFTDMSWLKALWIQVRGVLFEKEPKLA